MSIKFNSLLFEYKIELFATATAQAIVLAVIFLVGALHFIDTIQTSNNILLVSIQSRFYRRPSQSIDSQLKGTVSNSPELLDIVLNIYHTFLLDLVTVERGYSHWCGDVLQ